ncbi:MAG: PilT protein N-terminal [Rhodospirillales bacterium]|nr:PilT protein N-terminal [Rhodospirillales bacterium]
MTLVIDASVAAKWVVSESDSDRADALFDNGPLIAPRLWLTETANVLWKYWRRGQLTANDVSERVRILAGLPIEPVDQHEVLSIAVGFATSLDHSVYDCMYLAAATARSAILVTADHSFVRVVEKSPFAAFIRSL